jgi:sugar lactone lactonase YvrE
MIPVNGFLSGGGKMTVRMVLDSKDIVGESLVWDDRRRRLVWVDIVGQRIHALDPATGGHMIWPMAARPTSVALVADGSALVGTERHICRWNWRGEPEPLIEVEPDQPRNRLNEGTVGPDGAFWIGTMHQNIAPDGGPADIPEATGRLYRYTPDGMLTMLTDDRFGITNTLVWPTSYCLVTAYTLANAIFEYRIGSDGALHDRRTVLTSYPRGFPDGSTLDAGGFIWTARVAGGACLVRLSPKAGIDRVLELPCTWRTSCAFGGPDLSTLYIGSARFSMSPEHLAANPQEGGLFAVDAGVRGRAANRFAGA